MNSDFSLAVHSLTFLSLQLDQMATSHAIAESASVHPVRIRKILGLLRKQGFIVTKEGCGGGFILQKSPADIKLNEIYKITSEGALVPKCPPPNSECVVGANMKQAITSIFGDAENQLESFLSDYSIKDVASLVTHEPIEVAEALTGE
ncbi:RrF2 family transcriptional regulator [Virgibacillus senegalensis]|uniref:RrF2 family transcriptional regulator n=1 Tax=Virgibacillus senegalensis TaxID=1499679 RepID=UPI00069DED63|nr:Rrf2 family transcriptional regulator [Virgibacillus senegalensis]